MIKNRALLGAMVVAVLLGAAAYATADTQTFSAPAAGTVLVKASVNPKLKLTIGTPDALQSVNFGAVDPGVAVGGKTVNLLVDSNKDFAIAKSVTGDVALLGLSTTQALSVDGTKGKDVSFSDAYSINVPWDTAPGTPYNASVVYTVTQK